MDNNIGKKVSFSLSIIVLLAISNASLAYSSIYEANRLVKQSDYSRAFDVLKKDINSIGDKSYDLLLGQVASLVNKPDETVMACERVATLEPNNIQAKLCLAEAYCDLKNYTRVLEILLTIENKQLNFQENAQVEKLRARTQNEINRANRDWHVYGNLDIGFDNDFAAKTDFYLSPQLGIQGQHRLNNYGTYWYWDTNLQHRGYIDEAGYDITEINFLIGANHLLNDLYLFDGSFYYQEYLREMEHYRRSPILSLGASRIINSHNIIRLYTECGTFAYNNLNRDLNIYLLDVGLEWRYLDNRNLLSLRGLLGRHQPKFKDDAEKYSGSDYYGVRIMGRHKLTSKFSLGAEFSYYNICFDAKRFEHAANREESLYETSASIYYHLKPGYDWYVQCNYANNSSRLLYDRIDIFTGLSFKF